MIGILARLLRPGRQNMSFIATIILGLVGSVIGGVVANKLGTGDVFELNVVGFVVAVISAIILIGIFDGFLGRRGNR
jgi:uncharacterized membrane protein YeaQ/YmgE (transglycosylase-associated protein family)